MPLTVFVTARRAVAASFPAPTGVETGRLDVPDRLDDAVRTGVADVVVGQRHDVDAGVANAGLERRIEREEEPVRMVDVVVRGRTFVVHEREVRFGEHFSNGARMTGPFRRDGGETHATARPRGDPGRAAVPGIVGSGAEQDGVTVDLAVVHDVAGRHESPRRGRVEGGGAPLAGR